MRPRIKEDLLAMLRQAIVEIRNNNYGALAELSNHSIHNASIYQDEDSLSTAVLLYTLSKVLARCALRQAEAFCKSFDQDLQTAVQALERDDEEAFHAQIRRVLDRTAKVDGKLKMYITEVINQAEIKKGSHLYAHGFSLSHAAAMLGITQWELQSYIGHTTLTEAMDGEDIRKRLTFARTLFR